MDTYSREELHALICRYQTSYFEGNPIVTDEDYERTVEFFERKFHIHVFDFSTQPFVNTVLTIKFPSIKKIYDVESALFKKIVSSFESSIITSKLDGVAAILVKQNGEFSLFTKGPDDTGRDITNLIDGINFNKEALKDIDSIILRGELIISKNKKKSTISTPLRTRVVKTLNTKFPSFEELNIIDFVVYQILSNKNNTILEQIAFLESLDIKTVKHSSMPPDELGTELSITYDQYRKEEEYDIDGLVVYESSKIYSFEEKNSNIFAFKKNTLFQKTKVLDIIWSLSKKKKFIPILIVEPVTFNDYLVKKVNCYNAGYLLKNGLGIDAVLTIQYSGNVIASVKDVLQPSDNIKYPAEAYQWDAVNTHLVSSHIDVVSEILNYLDILKIRGYSRLKISKYISLMSAEITDMISFVKHLKAFRGNSKKQLELIDIFGTKLKIKAYELLTARTPFGRGIFRNDKLVKEICKKKSINDVERNEIENKDIISSIEYFLANRLELENIFEILY